MGKKLENDPEALDVLASGELKRIFESELALLGAEGKIAYIKITQAVMEERLRGLERFLVFTSNPKNLDGRE